MFACGIVLFNPELIRLRQCIASFIDDVDVLYLVDNFSENIDQVEEMFKNESKIRIIKLNNNYGIAYALNIIMESARNDSLEWVLTMDQDSVCSRDMIKRLYDYCHIDNTGIICPNIHEVGSTEINEYSNEYEKVKMCITAGSLTNVKCWEKIGGFNENLFIDMVDFEFCARLAECGYEIIRVNSAVLEQEVGKLHEVVIWKRHIKIRNHNILRHYYWSRNVIYCYRKHSSFFGTYFMIQLWVSEWIKVVLFEDNKLKKCKAMLKGFRDGIRMKV